MTISSRAYATTSRTPYCLPLGKDIKCRWDHISNQYTQVFNEVADNGTQPIPGALMHVAGGGLLCHGDLGVPRGVPGVLRDEVAASIGCCQDLDPPQTLRGDHFASVTSIGKESDPRDHRVIPYRSIREPTDLSDGTMTGTALGFPLGRCCVSHAPESPRTNAAHDTCGPRFSCPNRRGLRRGSHLYRL